MTKSSPNRITITAVLLVILLFMAMPRPTLAGGNPHGHNDDDVRFTFYVAVGGACAGLAWFIAYHTGFAPEKLFRKPALMNYQTDLGWSVGAPMPLLTNGTDHQATYLELVRIQFN